MFCSVAFFPSHCFTASSMALLRSPFFPPNTVTTASLSLLSVSSDRTIYILPNVRHHRLKHIDRLRAIKKLSRKHRANELFVAVKTASRPIRTQPYLIRGEHKSGSEKCGKQSVQYIEPTVKDLFIRGTRSVFRQTSFNNSKNLTPALIPC